jgi:PhnB protein
MTSQLNPYLSFKDSTKAAMEFYQTVFGGTLELHTFKEFHSSSDSSEDDLIMHAMLTADNGIKFMAADTPKQMEYKPGANISMSLSGDNTEELTEYFNKLAEGGSIFMKLEKAMWGDIFGMLTDKFGINWMVNINGGPDGQSANAPGVDGEAGTSADAPA